MEKKILLIFIGLMVSIIVTREYSTTLKKMIPIRMPSPIFLSKYEIARDSSTLPYLDEITLNKTPPSDVFTIQPYNKSKDLKKILFYNDYYGSQHWNFGYGQQPFIRAGCKVNTCFTTSDRKQFPSLDIDALIFHFRSGDKSLPKIRSPHTRYIFWLLEPPFLLFGNLKRFNGLFNWTMTYRRDSDVDNPYSFVYRRPLSNVSDANNHTYIGGKTKMAAQFVSNCNAQSQRGKLVANLQKYIKVDVFGRCGNLTCKRDTVKNCHTLVKKKYKFYLAFENSLCLDYATEKLFDMLRYDVVPVVYGLGQFKLVAPPYSYINVFDFDSAKDLADYLIYLDKHDDAYQEYFKWKRDFMVLYGDFSVTARTFCDLCEKLHKDNTTHIYEDIHRWYVDDSKCMSPNNENVKKLLA